MHVSYGMLPNKIDLKWSLSFIYTRNVIPIDPNIPDTGLWWCIWGIFSCYFWQINWPHWGFLLPSLYYCWWGCYLQVRPGTPGLRSKPIQPRPSYWTFTFIYSDIVTWSSLFSVCLAFSLFNAFPIFWGSSYISKWLHWGFFIAAVVVIVIGFDWAGPIIEDVPLVTIQLSERWLFLFWSFRETSSCLLFCPHFFQKIAGEELFQREYFMCWGPSGWSVAHPLAEPGFQFLNCRVQLYFSDRHIISCGSAFTINAWCEVHCASLQNHFDTWCEVHCASAQNHFDTWCEVHCTSVQNHFDTLCEVCCASLQN